MKHIETIRSAERRMSKIDYQIGTLLNERKLLEKIVKASEIDSEHLQFIISEYKQLYQRKQPWN
jgi:hypothetical protein